MWRSILSVLAGTFVWGILWVTANGILAASMPDQFREDGSTDSVGILAGILILSIVLSVLAGWVTSRLAPRNAMKHVFALGALQLLIGIAVQMQFWDLMPLWYHLSFLVMLVPGVILGGKLRER